MPSVPSAPDSEKYNPKEDDTKLVAPSAPNWLQFGIGKIDFKEFILPEPPSNQSQQTKVELEELDKLAETRTDSNVIALIHRWNNDPPGTNYNRYFDHLFQKYNFSPPQAARCQALFNEANYTALLAGWNNKWFYLRPRPDQVTNFQFKADLFLKPPAQQTPAHPAYPSGHSVSAGVFMAIGQFCFPQEDASAFFNFGRESSLARRQGGVHYYSDSVAGEALGFAVGQAFVELYSGDHSMDAKSVFSRPPSGDCKGTPTTTLKLKKPNISETPVLSKGNKIVGETLTFDPPPDVQIPPAEPIKIPEPK